MINYGTREYRAPRVTQNSSHTSDEFRACAHRCTFSQGYTMCAYGVNGLIHSKKCFCNFRALQPTNRGIGVDRYYFAITADCGQALGFVLVLLRRGSLCLGLMLGLWWRIHVLKCHERAHTLRLPMACTYTETYTIVALNVT